MKKKDNFNLKDYLVENKMTENSRGDVRHHLGETALDTRLFGAGLIMEWNDPRDHHDPDAEYDPNAEADYADTFYGEDCMEECGLDPQNVRRSFIDLCRAKGYDVDDPRRAVLWATIRDQVDGPEKDQLDINLGVDDTNVDQWLARQSELDADDAIDECPELNVPIAEVGYTGDDEEDGYQPDDLDLDDRGGASLLDLVGGRDKNAARARKVAARDTAADPAMDDDPVDTVDTPAIDDPEEEPKPASTNKWVKGDLSMDSLFGADAPNVEILAGDPDVDNDEALKQLFQRNKSYRPSLLQGAVKDAMDYFKEFENPSMLYLVPAIDRGGYELKRFNPGNRAVAAVYRPDSLKGKEWEKQIQA